MSVKIRQDQIKKSQDYDDAIPSGSVDLEINPTSALDDFNSIRSQLQRIIGEGDWWRDIPISLRAVSAYLGGFRKNQPVTPAPDGVETIFFPPEDFLYSTTPALSFLNPSVYLNGNRLQEGVDYTLEESGGVGTGFDSIEFVSGPLTTPRTGDLILVDYFISTGTIPPPEGGIGFWDEGFFIATRPAVNFIGTIVDSVDNPGSNRVDVTFVVTDADVIESPLFDSHWDTSDGNNGNQSVSESISRASVRISTPAGGEGTPFNTDGWDGTNQSGTLNTAGTYTTPSTTTGWGGDSTMTVTVYDADGTTVLETFTTPVITGDGVHPSGSGNIVVTITSFGDDPTPINPILTKKRAKASVSVDHDAILTAAGLTGGRFHVVIVHTTDTTSDGGGTYTYTQSDVFLDKNATTPAINGAVSIVERAGSVLTKHISGLEYYILNSEFNPSVADIDQLNRDTQRISSMLRASGVDYGFPALDQEPFPGGAGESFFTGWTNNHDQDNVDWDYIGWAITNASYRFIGATANISAFVRDPWGVSSTINSPNASVLIDTYVAAPTATFDSFDDESDRELIDGVGAGASGGSFPGAGLWSSSTALALGEALVQASEVRHPDDAPFLNWSTFKPDLGGANPDYTALAGQGFVDYGRRWTKTPSINIPSFAMVFTGTFAAGNMLADLIAGNVEMYVYRIAIPPATSGNFGAPPGNTTPLRMHVAFNFATYDDGATVPGSGIREGSSSGNTINCTFGTGTPADTGFYWHLRILNSATKVASASVTFF